MNILELNYATNWRGGERQTLYNAIGLREAGMTVAFVCRKNSILESRARESGFSVYSFKSVFGVLAFLCFNSKKFDVLHAQTSQILTYCILSKPFHKSQVVFTRRIDFVPKGRVTRLKYRLSDKLVGVSTAVKLIVERFAKRPVTLISDIVIKRDLNKNRAETLLDGLAIPSNTIILATLAALVPHKDPLTLIRSIAALLKIRKDFIFLHFGTGELHNEMIDLINELGLADNYRLMGFHENPEDYYSVFDVFVMSSKEEGLGSSVLDAFLYRVPVVSTHAGGLQDLIQNERGISCSIGNPVSICEGIQYVLTNREKMNDMIDKAEQYVTSFHSSEYISKQYIKLIAQKE